MYAKSSPPPQPTFIHSLLLLPPLLHNFGIQNCKHPAGRKRTRRVKLIFNPFFFSIFTSNKDIFSNRRSWTLINHPLFYLWILADTQSVQYFHFWWEKRGINISAFPFSAAASMLTTPPPPAPSPKDECLHGGIFEFGGCVCVSVCVCVCECVCMGPQC